MKLIAALIFGLLPLQSMAEAEFTDTPYEPPKVLFDFYFDRPQKIASALFWVRSTLNPAMQAPYELSPEDLHLVVLIHGTEIVTLAEKNYEKYSEVVERMRYYADLGVEFRVCALAAADYDYQAEDFYDFVQIVPSAMLELTHWQQQGYGLVAPKVMEKHFEIREIR